MNVIYTDDEGNVLAKFVNVGTMAIDKCDEWLSPYEEA